MSIFSSPSPPPVPQPVAPPTIEEAKKSVPTVRRPKGSKSTILTGALGDEFEGQRKTLGGGSGIA